ncbi:MAG: hypothetical protein LUD81_09225, partial [Clostridiales bacterium]|nr:hypothetical protein [Clostridiales bacterium]
VISFPSNIVCNIKQDLPLGCKSIGLIPIENKFSVVRYFGASTNMGLIKEFNHSGKNIGDVILFDTQAPLILINLPENSNEINIRMLVCGFESHELLNEFMGIHDKLSGVIDENRRIEALKNELSEKNEKLSSEYREAELSVARLEDTIEDINKENSEKINELNACIVRLQADNATILSSSCWKITKPIRVIIEFIRSFRSFSEKKNWIKKLFGKTYSIDKSTYNDGIYSLSGWVFSEKEEIRELALVITAGGESLEITEGNFNIWRPDVFNAYNCVSVKNSGFEFSVLVNTDKNFDVSLKYLKGSKAGRINCGTFKGEKTVGDDDRIISVIKSGVPVDIGYMINKYISDEPC